MKYHSAINKRFFLPVKTTIIVAMIVVITGIGVSAFENKNNVTTNNAAWADSKTDSIESVQAFKTVYKVLMSPRCMNCHPAGDVPLQGEDSHLHTMFPKRGIDGKGVYAMKCANCHQPANVAGLHMPPGNPNWHLPPSDTKMVFQGRTATQLAKQLMDPKQNGNKSKQQLIAHASDNLVMAAWNPGEGRSLPPMSHKDFSKAWITWITKGAYAPK
jgi:mono/diheme cytochrome c family protein